MSAGPKLLTFHLSIGVMTDEHPMSIALEPAQIQEYQTRGFLFPLEVMPESEASWYYEQFQAFERREGGKLSSRNQKPHLFLKWLSDLIRDPRILDPVEDVLGPDILCWNSGFFVKNAHDPARVTWHQDSTYWGLSKPDIVTAWVALTPSTVENGCMRVIPETHTSDQLPHRDTFGKNNLLTRGQEIAVEVDESRAIDIVLRPGQMSLHHVRLVHGSEPNQASIRRVGFAIRYVATHVEQLTGEQDSATLVRGNDRYGHFLLEPSPVSDFHPDALAFHAKALETFTRIVYSGAAQKPSHLS